ncbi:MAG: mismatch-specific DNA-glycosylase [Chloroflexota bacterium]
MTGVLPDVLCSGLRVVFCGTAAGSASARAGAYYAGPGNSFWATLHATGLTPVRLAPAEFQRLPELGIGLTDVCKVRHGSDREVGAGGFDVAGLESRIAEARPANLAFNGKNAARAALGRKVEYGRRPERLGDATVWVLPSTSGAARGFWDIAPWEELARAARSFGALRITQPMRAPVRRRSLSATSRRASVRTSTP